MRIIQSRVNSYISREDTNKKFIFSGRTTKRRGGDPLNTKQKNTILTTKQKNTIFSYDFEHFNTAGFMKTVPSVSVYSLNDYYLSIPE